MASPLIGIVGDANPKRQFDPPMKDAAKARKAAEDLGEELAKRGARLIVYGGRLSRRTLYAALLEATQPKTGPS